jgi:hypothetical protein
MRPEITGLQLDVLRALADFEPPWTLTGGGALAAVHLGHRTTRDLDLFWHGESRIADRVDLVVEKLRDAGLEVAPVQRTATFCRLSVRRGGEATVLDRVAEPVPAVEPPRRAGLADFTLLVDTPHEILVNKLNALLSRSELRDLIDVRALLAAGGDLDRALTDAATKDGGFSAMTLAWSLRDLRIEALAKRADLDPAELPALCAFRDQLVAHLAADARPT